MNAQYRVIRQEPVTNTDLVNVYFSYGACEEGNVTVPKSMVDTPQLDAVIQLQLRRQQEQKEQLAAGGD